jgi:hypothetical protein
MEVTEELETRIVDTLHKIRIFDESIRQLRHLGASVAVRESERMRQELADNLAQLTARINQPQPI